MIGTSNVLVDQLIALTSDLEGCSNRVKPILFVLLMLVQNLLGFLVLTLPLIVSLTRFEGFDRFVVFSDLIPRFRFADVELRRIAFNSYPIVRLFTCSDGFTAVTEG